MREKDIGRTELPGGRYRIIDILGKGGTSTVYLVENTSLGILWAAKEIKKDSVFDADWMAKEINILKKLSHNALPKIIDIIEDEKCIYIIQDFIEGVSLDKELERVGKFDENKVIEWAKQICDVLIYLHSFKPNPIIYRDMKPSNIILTPSGDIKLVDFGIAREYKEGQDEDTVYIGTRGYAAPEQYGSGQSNVATDIYSFGVTLYQLLTGKKPAEFQFGLKLPEHVAGNISHGMMQIISKCTRFNPQERYRSVQELKKDIVALEISKKTADIGMKESIVNFRRLILTVWDNAEFACEMAYVTAKITGLEVLLADLDLLSPKVDLYLNIKKYPGRLQGEGILNESGINIVLDSIEKGHLSRENLIGACIKRKELKNLYILTGNYRLENYEYYTNESLVKFIEKASQVFDIVILAVSKSIYDSFTVISLIKSDYNIIPICSDVDKLREFNNYIVFLKEKQQIRLDKSKFVAFDYDPSVNLGEDAIKEVTQHNYLGKVRYSKKRARCRNLMVSYARKMDKDVIKDYMLILKNLRILPQESNKTIRSKIYKGWWKYAHSRYPSQITAE